MESSSCRRKLTNWSQREMEPLFRPSAHFPNHYQASSIGALAGAKLRHGRREWHWGSHGSLFGVHRDPWAQHPQKRAWSTELMEGGPQPRGTSGCRRVQDAHNAGRRGRCRVDRQLGGPRSTPVAHGVAPGSEAWMGPGQELQIQSRPHSEPQAESSREGESEATRHIYHEPSTGPTALQTPSSLTCPPAPGGKITFHRCQN